MNSLVNTEHPSTPFPPGYEMKRTPQGQVFFVHLPSGARTWHDPRIPKDVIRFISSSRNTENNSDELLGPMPEGKTGF